MRLIDAKKKKYNSGIEVVEAKSTAYAAAAMGAAGAATCAAI